MGKIRCHCECPSCECTPKDPCKCMHPCNIRPSTKAAFLLERVIAQGCLDGCMRLTVVLQECVQIDEICEICYDGCILDQSCSFAPCNERIWKTALPITIRLRDCCGERRCVKGTLNLEIPLRMYDPFAHEKICKSLLLSQLQLIRIVCQHGNCFEGEWRLCVQLYVTCLQVQSVCIPAPNPCCEFPPIYPQPCRDKKHFDFVQ